MPTNFLKTGLLLIAMTGILVGTGTLVGGESGLIISFILALGMNAFTFWKSDSLVLRMHGAREVDRSSAPELVAMVERLAQRAELPMPRVYVMQNPQPNAFATGRSPSRAAVAASTGLLDMLSPQEVAAVMAHELAHIKNRDTLTMTVAATMAGAIAMFANMLQFGMLFGGGRNGNRGLIGTLVAVFLAPFAAMLVQMAISRSREYEADRVGAAICGNPLWLASALRDIDIYAHQIRNPSAERVPASAHLFIVNPLTGRGMDGLFTTHPRTANRIQALEDLAANWGIAEGPSDAERRFTDVASLGLDQPTVDGGSVPTVGGSGRGPWG